MDEIQKVLVKVGRKDLAQKYYLKIAAKSRNHPYFAAVKKIYNKLKGDINKIDFVDHAFGVSEGGVFEGQYLLKNKKDVIAYLSFKANNFDSDEDKQKVVKIIESFVKTFKGTKDFSKKVYFEKDDKWLIIGFTEK